MRKLIIILMVLASVVLAQKRMKVNVSNLIDKHKAITFAEIRSIDTTQGIVICDVGYVKIDKQDTIKVITSSDVYFYYKQNIKKDVPFLFDGTVRKRFRNMQKVIRKIQ